MGSFIDVTTKMDWAKAFNRVGNFPLDRSSIFSTLADAKKYAAGKSSDPDSRGLQGTSYVGQTITVYENGVIKQYLIEENRSLTEIAVYDDVNYLSGVLSTEIKTRKADTEILSSTIGSISADVKGHINYKGHVPTLNKQDMAVSPLTSFNLNILIARMYDHTECTDNFLSVDTKGDYSFLSSFPLNNGWMYCIDLSDEYPLSTGKYKTRDNIELTDKDFVIIHNHNGPSVQLSDVCKDNIDIIETQDSDYVRFNLLSSISVELSSDYVEKIQSVKDTLDIISVHLDSLELSTFEISNKVDNLCTEISNTIDNLCTEISTDLSGKYNYLSNEISSNDKDIENISTSLYIAPNKFGNPGLSGKVDWLLSVGQKTMEYNGTLLSGNAVKSNRLTSLFYDNFGDEAHQFKQGQTYRISCIFNSLSDDNSETIELRNNDYIIFNKDKKLKEVLVKDIDIIYDARNEVINVSNDLSILRNNVNNICIEISTDLSGKYNYLSNEISSNDKDIENISAHYDTTFTKDVEIPYGGTTISVDVLNLTDEKHKQYTLQLSAGTLVLVPKTK